MSNAKRPWPYRPLSRRTVLITTCVVGMVVLLSWFVGTVGATHGFDWGLAATFGTALGTTLLAVTTGRLALLTSREVSATQQLAELTREDQIARGRPVVIVHAAVFLENRAGPPDPGVRGHIGLQVFNAGLGPALRVRIEAEYEDPEYQPEMRPAVWPAIMAGGREDFAIQPVYFPKAPPGGVNPDGFTIHGDCLDRSRTQTHPVIIEWRTSKDGAYGAFDAAGENIEGSSQGNP